ncbi:MAG: sulfatase/phosphatase domain-containing protein, partial [Planctomycetota bacterium]
ISGKWQINDFRLQPKILNELGFDEYCIWTGYEKGNPPSAKRYWDPYIHTAEGSKTYKGQFGPDIYNKFVLDFIEEHKDEPMMIYYPMNLTHGPLTTTPHNKDEASKKVMVEYMDYLVGKLVKALDECGARRNTIIIWSTDNGSAKGRTSEKGACEPFVVNCPGLVPEGVVTDALVDFTDLLPTFCDLAGAKLPRDHTLDGKSFAPLILGSAKDSDRNWIMAMGGGGIQATKTDHGWRVFNKHEYRDRAIRDKQYKLYIGTDRKTEKLIDLKADPQEKINIIQSDNSKVKAALARLKKVAATFPEKDANPKYDPLPLQSWDNIPEQKKQKQNKKPRRKK